MDAKGYEEICVALVGSVDASKSSTIGTLTTGTLDDGNGLSRSTVFIHPHEHSTGRTSDISFQYLKDDESKRIISFVDLAGHEAYLKTTISGLSSSYPDMAFVCISDKITDMTKEHINLCIAMGVPFVILFTKIDMIPHDVTKFLARETKMILRKLNRNLQMIKTMNDLDLIMKHFSSDGLIVPFVLTSNKTGEGLDIVRNILRRCPKRHTALPQCFTIEHIYNVHGIGLVASGLVGEKIQKGTVAYIGPFQNGKFFRIVFKSLHNDYRFNVDELQPGVRGCVCFSAKGEDSKYITRRTIHPGMMIRTTLPQNVCQRFIAQVRVLHHHTTIKIGFQGVLHSGMIRETVELIGIRSYDERDVKSIKSGDEAYVMLRFLKHFNYLEPNQPLIFREGQTRCVGVVVRLLPINDEKTS
jgi:GTPase